MSRFLRSVSGEFIDGEFDRTDSLAESVVALLVSVGEPNRSALRSARAAHLEHVKAFIRLHLENQDLTPRTVADGNRISLRYLHGIFEGEGTTVNQYLILQRLQLAQRVLGRPSSSKRKITDVANSCGFQSATHFSRRFKEAFGMTPEEFRESSVHAFRLETP